MPKCEQIFLLYFVLGCTKIFAVLTIKWNLWVEKPSLPYYKGYKKYTFGIIKSNILAWEKRNNVSLGRLNKNKSKV